MGRKGARRKADHKDLEVTSKIPLPAAGECLAEIGGRGYVTTESTETQRGYS